MSDDVAPLVAALALACMHLISARLRFLDVVPRSHWLSAFGGISVAYVFVHLLPELAEAQVAIEGVETGDEPLLGFLEQHVYLVALVGLALFYGVEQHSARSRARAMAAQGTDVTSSGAFWLSIASFSVYNAVVGYLLLREEMDELQALTLYAVALGLHFVVNDFGLREHHKAQYDRIGRWVIAAAVVAGCVLGMAIEVPERVIALIVAFIGGGVILNVLKEELPGERRARFLPFAGGAIAYTALLQLG